MGVCGSVEEVEIHGARVGAVRLATCIAIICFLATQIRKSGRASVNCGNLRKFTSITRTHHLTTE